MAHRLYGRAAMTAAGLTVLFMAGSSHAQEYEIRGCRPNVDLSACCPNMHEFPPGSLLLSNGVVCRLDNSRAQDVLTTGSIGVGRLEGIPGGRAGGVAPGANNGGKGGGNAGGGKGGGNAGGGHDGGSNPGKVTDKAAKDNDNRGIGNGWESSDLTDHPTNGVDTSWGDPDNPAHGASGHPGKGGGDKGGAGDKGGKGGKNSEN